MKAETILKCWYGRKIDVICLGAMLVVFAGYSVNVAAQQASDGVPIKVGETKLYPSLRMDYLSNDNVFLTKDDKVSSNGLLISPSASWVADQRTLRITARYQGAYAAYDESVLDYNDHRFSVLGQAELSRRVRLRGNVSYSREHEELGSNLTRGRGDEFDEQVVYNRLAFNPELEYGASEAKGNLRFGMHVQNYAPANLKAESGRTEYFSLQPYAEFSVSLSPDTRFVTQLRYTDLDYKIGTRDQQRVAILGGVSFSPTGKLGGTFRVGASHVTFTNSETKDETDLVLETNLTYKMTDYSALTLAGKREFDNEDGANLSVSDSVSTSDTLALKWRHDWSGLFYQTAALSYRRSNRICPADATSLQSVGTELNYKAKRWLDVGIGVAQSSRDIESCSADEDTDESLDYDRQTVGVHFRATL